MGNLRGEALSAIYIYIYCTAQNNIKTQRNGDRSVFLFLVFVKVNFKQCLSYDLKPKAIVTRHDLYIYLLLC